VIPHGILLSASPPVGGGTPITIGLVIGIQLTVVAVLLAAFSSYVRDRRPTWARRARLGAVAAAVPALILVLAGVLDATGGGSSNAVVNPVPDTVDSVDAGAVLYQANCARCHGIDGLGGGVDAGTTQVRPPNLRSGHLNQHSDADIYIWISNGLPGGMPAWSGQLTETDRWNLVNYLRAINGRGPPPAPSGAVTGSSSDRAPEMAGLAVAGSVGSLLLGWLAVGLGRPGRRRPPRGNDETGGDGEDDDDARASPSVPQTRR
jgi:mono/diheme cytochrome c family protein